MVPASLSRQVALDKESRFCRTRQPWVCTDLSRIRLHLFAHSSEVVSAWSAHPIAASVCPMRLIVSSRRGWSAHRTYSCRNAGDMPRFNVSAASGEAVASKSTPSRAPFGNRPFGIRIAVTPPSETCARIDARRNRDLICTSGGSFGRVRLVVRFFSTSVACK